MRKPGQAQTDHECAKGKGDGAHDRLAPNAKNLGAGKLHSNTVDAQAWPAILSISFSDSEYGARSTPRSVMTAVT